MSIAEQLAFEDRIVIVALVIAAVAGFALWRLATSDRRRNTAALKMPPRPAPRTPGPLPRAGEVDRTDYVDRVLRHVPCEATTCSHKPWPDLHCRECDQPYPCRLSGPLNPPRSHFDADRRAFQRNWRETGRWDV